MDSCSGVYWYGVPQPEGEGEDVEEEQEQGHQKAEDGMDIWVGEVKSTIQCKEILWNQGNKYSEPCS